MERNNENVPPPKPAIGHYPGVSVGTGHAEPEKPGLFERLTPNILIGVIAASSFVVGGVAGTFIPSPTQSGTVDSCHTAIELGEDIQGELRGSLYLSADAVAAVRDMDYGSLDDINLGLDEHIGAVETLTPEYETAKNRCGA